MDAAAGMAAIAIVLARGDSPVTTIGELQELRFCPVQHLELSVMEHLVASVDRDRIVTRGAHEVLVPLRRSVVLKATAIDENVLAAPPHVEVQHVNLREAVAERSAAERAEAPFVAAAQDVISGRAERYGLPQWTMQRRIQRAHAEEPRRFLVPRAGFVDALAADENADRL